MIFQSFSYKLRNKFICRISIVMAIFMGYSVFMLLFIYYVQNINDQAVRLFFSYNKLGIYLTTSHLYMKCAIMSGNKILVGSNNVIILYEDRKN